MPKITIDDIEYNTEDLTENGKAQLASLQFLEGQMLKIRNEMAVYQTAQRSYVAALKAEIARSGVQPLTIAEEPGLESNKPD
ncbi:DUF6447 family protein [Planktotalea arctica]|uniref:DUF6447 family protein n=1 Tax=Planktotalea arctica TaxID=1481893 RepID=UPI000A177610|nr:DUF6447 family protein [Planktotalea arctica]